MFLRKYRRKSRDYFCCELLRPQVTNTNLNVWTLIKNSKIQFYFEDHCCSQPFFFVSSSSSCFCNSFHLFSSSQNITLCFSLSNGVPTFLKIDYFLTNFGPFFLITSKLLVAISFSEDLDLDRLLPLLFSRFLSNTFPSILSFLLNPESFLINLILSVFLSSIDPDSLRLLFLTSLCDLVRLSYNLTEFSSSRTKPKLMRLSEHMSKLLEEVRTFPSMFLTERAESLLVGLVGRWEGRGRGRGRGRLGLLQRRMLFRCFRGLLEERKEVESSQAWYWVWSYRWRISGSSSRDSCFQISAISSLLNYGFLTQLPSVRSTSITSSLNLNSTPLFDADDALLSISLKLLKFKNKSQSCTSLLSMISEIFLLSGYLTFPSDSFISLIRQSNCSSSSEIVLLSGWRTKPCRKESHAASYRPRFINETPCLMRVHASRGSDWRARQQSMRADEWEPWELLQRPRRESRVPTTRGFWEWGRADWYRLWADWQSLALMCLQPYVSQWLTFSRISLRT